MEVAVPAAGVTVAGMVPLRQPCDSWASLLLGCLFMSEEVSHLFRNMNKPYLELYTDGEIADTKSQSPPFDSAALSYQEQKRRLWPARVLSLLQGCSSKLDQLTLALVLVSG